MFKKQYHYFTKALFLLLFSFVVNTSIFGEDNAKANEANPKADKAVLDAGASLFKQNCSACHAIHEVVVGPALKDIYKRRQLPWIVDFVHNSTKVIEAGDKYAVELYNKYNKTQMTSFPSLTKEEITSIVEYIKDEGTKGPVVADGPALDKGNTGTVAPVDNTFDDITLILIVIVLLLVVIILIVFITVLRKYLKDKSHNIDDRDVEVINQKLEFGKFFKSTGFIVVISVLFVAVGARACWNNMFYIGVEQGYRPVQPIPFSHKLHAGEYKIDCNYCHTGVTKGKQANIPSLNICMNCHSQIRKGPIYGKEAIAKVVEAYKSNTPVKWIRVHNLPDLSYFNHAQHVKVGGLECVSCHGQIDTMEVVHQHAPLTMGWCINCHRETKVNGKDNNYYAKLLESHSKVSKKDLKVADIGGLECSKCHY